MEIPEVIKKQMQLDSEINIQLQHWRKHIITMFISGRPVVELAVKSNPFRMLCHMAYLNDLKNDKLLPLTKLTTELKNESWELAKKESANYNLTRSQKIKLAECLYWFNDIISDYVE